MSGVHGSRAVPADEAVRLAMGALRAGRVDEAARVAGDVLKHVPRHPEALHISGCAFLMQGRAADAIAPLQEAARLKHDPEVDTQLAIALRETGRTDDALGRLKRAIKRKPPFAPAYHELGFLLFTLKRYDEAVDALRQGLAFAPMMPDLSVQLGHVLLARGDRAGAKAALTHAVSIKPDHADALFSLAMAHAGDGEFAAAAARFRQCLMVQPDNDSAWPNLGQCLLQLGDREAAYECFRTTARRGGIRYGLALAALAKSGRGRMFLRPSAAARFMRGKTV